MLLSKNWLSEYVTLEDVSPRQFTHDLTMSGSKVEGWSVEGGDLSNIVVGKVLSVEKHQNADTLFVCKIDVGRGEPVQIVTGAANVVPGAMVPAALDNSTVSGGKKIKKGKIRGEMSEGMLCSLEELGLTAGDFPYAQADGIFLLEEPDIKPGQDIREALGLCDTVFEFEITSNRPDCLSIIGLARETAATYGVPLRLHNPVVKGSGDRIENYLKVRVESPSLCLRYAAAAVKNVKIVPSPRWLRERLRASGVRPISNIVDITNYVMLEYGQPMHAFDLQHVQGGQIVVRQAAPGEKITTLDSAERVLSPEMLVIADGATPSAVAGVMGGEWSGIYDNTQTVIFESACFDGASVRTTAKKLGMRTESSGRFEKGLDPENCLPALRRACELVELLDAGEVVDGVLDIRGDARPPVKIPLDVDWINRFLGISVPGDEMERILGSLDIRVENGMAIPPTFRADLEGKADLSEEIARIYGYDKIPTTALRGLAQGTLTPAQRYTRHIGQILLGQGLSEIVTYSFISPKYYDKIRLPEDSPLRASVTIRNPLGEDTSVMRTTALPSMMEILSRNYNNRVPAAALYEIATVYQPTTPTTLPTEPKQIMIGMYGDADFYTLKGVVEMLLNRSGIHCWEVAAEKGNPTFHPGRCAALTTNGAYAGVLGQVHPLVCENYGITANAYMAQLDFETLLQNQNPDRSFRHLPRFPASTRDLALVCDEGLPVMDIQRVIHQSVGKILEEIALFDIYRGKQVGEGKKSVAFSLTLRTDDRTLTDEECDKSIAKALKALEPLGVRLR